MKKKMLRAVDRALGIVLLQSSAATTTTGFAIVFTPESEKRVASLQTRVMDILGHHGLSLSPQFCETARVHVTLVQQVGDAADGRAIARAAAAVLGGDATAEIESIHLQAPNWLFLNIRLDRCIKAAHVACADRCVGHMVGTDRKNQADTPQEAEMRARYGYRYMFDAYTIPHVTLGVLSDAGAFTARREDIMREMEAAVCEVFGGDMTLHVAGVTHYAMSQDGKGSHARTLHFEPVG